METRYRLPAPASLIGDDGDLTLHANVFGFARGEPVRESTVAVSLLMDMVSQLEARGVSRQELTRMARVDPRLLERAHDRVPGSAAARIWQAAEELTGDPLIGLHLAEEFRAGATHILGHVVQHCTNAGEALERLTRYAALLNDGMRVQTSPSGEFVTVRIEAVPGMRNVLVEDGRQVFETMAAGTVVALRRLVGRPLVPARVTFRHAPAGPRDEYERVFGTGVHFLASEVSLVFRGMDLAAPVPAADPTLLSLFEEHAARRLDDLERLGGTTRRVAEHITAGLHGLAPTLGDVARRMAVSSRQLQRLLRDEGTSYNALLEGERARTAKAALRRPGGSIAAVALMLGYSEVSAFHRAFRRWTGMSPGAWTALEDEPPERSA